ncbi:hypothetical protein [Oceanobacillus chungangensis]|uniref:Uncharacterized protein n=1 Tax=Oceanobacillus chungangensis TaxID=1229152 RepID=A0A3D8PGB3_9BACI|nr:hypothetical protein [Oceanobacillus chungangensis]RDW15123.1 hypothetical protein CWR45_18320 [Oceanobacillus chungangensis]
MMKKHTKFGKIIGWLGFLFFMLGFAFNERIGVMVEDIPEVYYPFSLPSIIIGIILLVISNFFKKRTFSCFYVN